MAIGAGFKGAYKGSEEPAADQADESAEQELARMVVQRLNSGFPKAALAAAVTLVETICANHDLPGGAFL